MSQSSDIENDVETQRNLKQKFLVEQIIDGGYNPEEFSTFLGKRKKDGTDVDNWSLDQLIGVIIISYLQEVEEFIRGKDKLHDSKTRLKSIGNRRTRRGNPAKNSTFTRTRPPSPNFAVFFFLN